MCEAVFNTRNDSTLIKSVIDTDSNLYKDVTQGLKLAMWVHVTEERGRQKMIGRSLFSLKSLQLTENAVPFLQT